MITMQWNSPSVKIFLIFLIILLDKSVNLSSSNNITESSGDSLKIEVSYFNLSVHYPSTGIQYYRDGIIYLLDSKFSRKSKGEYVPFGSISMYYSPLSDTKIEKQIYFLRKKPFPYPADAISFTADYSKIFFTRESKFRGYRDNSIRIYEAEINIRKSGKSDLTSRPAELPFNSKMYSCVQPAVSPDGKFMIFASDMPGGQGGLDLYYTIYEDRSWESPINLGNDINTAADESFPFIDSEGNLYFSSNGHNGYGKHDVYLARLKNRFHWDKPVNMGSTLNSEKDDIAFILDRDDETQGFLASDRNVVGKQYQLFRVKISGSIKSIGQDQLVFEEESKSKTIEKETEEIPEAHVTISEKPKLTDDKTEMNESEKPEMVIPIEEEQTIPYDIKESKEMDNQKVIFRVQFKSSGKSLGSFNVVVNDREYKTFEYYYKGAYRYTIGEFENLDEAIKLSLDCRKKGYPQAFVAAFRESERVLDPQVFKK